MAAMLLTLRPGIYILPAQDAPDVPRITFRKILKDSSPEYMALSIDARGAGTYDGRKLDDPPAPRSLQLSADTTARIFSLAESLKYFHSLQLDSHHKVANMGLKTLTYEAGKQVNQVQYNYTEVSAARQLTDIFEKIGNVEEHIARLEYAMKYDHLSLPGDLRQIQIDMADHNLVEAPLLLPALEKIASNPRFLHLAQARAQDLIGRIQETK
jgi:ribosomal protein S6